MTRLMPKIPGVTFARSDCRQLTFSVPFTMSTIEFLWDFTIVVRLKIISKIIESIKKNWTEFRHKIHKQWTDWILFLWI